VTALHAVPDLPDADLDALEQAVDKGLTAAVASLTPAAGLHAHTRRGFEHVAIPTSPGSVTHLRRLRWPDEERSPSSTPCPARRRARGPCRCGRPSFSASP
jgi:hypothetical protein